MKSFSIFAGLLAMVPLVAGQVAIADADAVAIANGGGLALAQASALAIANGAGTAIAQASALAIANGGASVYRNGTGTGTVTQTVKYVTSVVACTACAVPGLITITVPAVAVATVNTIAVAGCPTITTTKTSTTGVVVACAATTLVQGVASATVAKPTYPVYTSGSGSSFTVGGLIAGASSAFIAMILL